MSDVTSSCKSFGTYHDYLDTDVWLTRDWVRISPTKPGYDRYGNPGRVRVDASGVLLIKRADLKAFIAKLQEALDE